MDLEKFIRTVPDFPIKGINFYDITTLFDNKITFNYIIQLLSKRYKSKGLDKIVAIEARGFILGSALAHSLNVGFVPIRKKGKLPYKKISNTYSLEYGEDTIEIHVDILYPTWVVFHFATMICSAKAVFLRVFAVANS